MKIAWFLALPLACASPGLAHAAVGVAALHTSAGDPERPLSLTIWYPAAEGGPQVTVGGNAVFAGTVASRDAPPPSGHLPLVLVSHGGLRSAADSGAWLSAALARSGSIAVEINGPRPRSAGKAVDEIWRRPDDARHALDALLADPQWSGHIDRARISVVGVALGGTAALALAGGQFDPLSFARSCERPAGGPDCAWYAAHRVDLAAVDERQLASPHRDPRITSAVAIDPEYMDVFAPSSLAAIRVPVLLATLGKDAASGGAAGALKYARIAAATLVDAFPVCTPAGPAILAEGGGDAGQCGTSAADRNRAHAAIAARVVSFLNATAQKAE